MRRKEFAVSLGLATAGRGRMSREALEAIEKARSEGMTFDDDAPTTGRREVTVTAKDAKPVTVRSSTALGHIGLMDDTYIRYGNDVKFAGVDSKGKKHTVGVANICRNSGYSIIGCRCDSHETLVASMEVITVTEVK